MPDSRVTELLGSWRQGNKAALDQLIPFVYDELRRVARARLKDERAGHSLQTTALVHEAYVKLVDLNRMSFHDRAHFFAVAARLMRQILVDHARELDAQKRGRSVTIAGLDDLAPSGQGAPDVDVLALDEALEQLTNYDLRVCKVVELRFFAGMNIDETAEALQISTATVERDWAFAKAWLHQKLSPAADS